MDKKLSIEQMTILELNQEILAQNKVLKDIELKNVEEQSKYNHLKIKIKRIENK